MRLRLLSSLARALPLVGPFLRRRDLYEVRLLLALAELDLLRAQVAVLMQPVRTDMAAGTPCTRLDRSRAN